MLTNSTILITGGTGSFGNTFVPMTLAKYNPNLGITVLLVSGGLILFNQNERNFIDVV